MPHSVFLHAGCILPDDLGLRQNPFRENWTIVEDIAVFSLDQKVRRTGWYFFWPPAAFVLFSHG